MTTYFIKTAWTDEFHFIPEREINFVNSAGLQQNAPFCVLLKKKSFFHGFIILYLKFWLHRFYIQNAAECSILHPSEKKDPLPLLVSRGLACMQKHNTICVGHHYTQNKEIT
jgi:hypothetical protein